MQLHEIIHPNGKHGYSIDGRRVSKSRFDTETEAGIVRGSYSCAQTVTGKDGTIHHYHCV